MFIKDKNRDYYDHITEMFGIDYYKTFNRESESADPIFRTNFILYFCGEYFSIIDKEDKGFERYMNLTDKEKVKYSHFNIYGNYNYSELIEFDKHYLLKLKDFKDKDFFERIQKENGLPYFGISFRQIGVTDNKPKYFIPLLREYGFNKVYDAVEAYTKIDNLLQPKDVVIDTNPTNMVRFEQKGFNKKTSFRK